MLKSEGGERGVVPKCACLFVFWPFLYIVLSSLAVLSTFMMLSSSATTVLDGLLSCPVHVLLSFP